MNTRVTGTTRLLVRPDQTDLRLDQFMAQATGLSRRRSRVLISEGSVSRNGRPVRVQSRPIEAGDVVDLVLPDAELTQPPWRPPAVRLVHDDEWLAVVDKPPGVLSQPADGPSPDDPALDELTLLNLALREGRRPFLRLVHRIDRLTAGLVVFARSQQALAPLSEAWRENRVRRFYLAVVVGRPRWEEEMVEQPIGRDTNAAWRFRIDPRGRPARTRVQLLAHNDLISIVLCELDTGRTHQVRVHLAHLGHPVYGDRLYGGAMAGVQHPLLLAWALELPHPNDGHLLQLTAAIPEIMAAHLPAAPLDPPWSQRSG